MVLQLAAGVEKLVTEATEPVSVLYHVRLEVYWSSKTSITDIARHVLVIPLAVFFPQSDGELKTEVVVREDVGGGDEVHGGVLCCGVTALTHLSFSSLIFRLDGCLLRLVL